MERFTTIATLLLIATPTYAQSLSTTKLGSAEGQQVFVIDSDRREWQGKLIKVSADALEIDGEAGFYRFALASVRRVDADGDRVHDGLVKGVVFGAVIGSVFSSSRYKAQGTVGGAVAYGLVGVAIDALNSSKHTVYRGMPSPPPQLTMNVSW